MFTAFDVDFTVPTFIRASFVEGDRHGETRCFSVSVVNDNDFEETTEDFIAYIQEITISPENTILGNFSFTRVIINDTEGMYSGHA